MRVITESELAVPRRNEIENEINFHSSVLYIYIYIYISFLFLFFIV